MILWDVSPVFLVCLTSREMLSKWTCILSFIISPKWYTLSILASSRNHWYFCWETLLSHWWSFALEPLCWKAHGTVKHSNFYSYPHLTYQVHPSLLCYHNIAWVGLDSKTRGMVHLKLETMLTIMGMTLGASLSLCPRSLPLLVYSSKIILPFRLNLNYQTMICGGGFTPSQKETKQKFGGADMSKECCLPQKPKEGRG